MSASMRLEGWFCRVPSTYTFIPRTGRTHKEDFRHGSAAAACGGVTTICDMPNTRPAVVTAEILSKKIEAVATSSYVDFGFGQGTHTNEFAAFRDRGAVGLEAYMVRAPPGSQSVQISCPCRQRDADSGVADAELDGPGSGARRNSSLEGKKLSKSGPPEGRRSARGSVSDDALHET